MSGHGAEEREASGAFVELRNVFCVHRTEEGDAAALQGMDLRLDEGELLAVLGPSGAGKSTLLRVIAGLQVPSAGTVSVLGADIGRLRARERARLRHDRLGFLGQHAAGALPPDLAIGRAVELPLALRRAPDRERRARVRELLDAVSLGDRAEALPAELSGGERQRAALCVALAHRPALLLADEPTGELDADSARVVRTLIASLARSQGATVLVVSHEASFGEIADRTVRISDGRAVEVSQGGESAAVLARGGWLRLPAGLLAEAGIRDRVRIEPTADGIVLLPAAGAAPPVAQAPAASTDTGEPPAATAIELRGVRRLHGRGATRRTTIEALDLTFDAGRMTVLTGRSGAGKTTVLRLLAGLDAPDAGEVVIDGRSLGELSPEQRATVRRSRIGYLSQEPYPVGFLSAEENIILALSLRGWPRRPAAERAAVTLARVGLSDRARQLVSRLSAGEAQRVALARALAAARGLLIVDEPTSRLDAAATAEVAELLRAAAEEGQTVVCATHDPAVIVRADRVVEIERALQNAGVASS